MQAAFRLHMLVCSLHTRVCRLHTGVCNLHAACMQAACIPSVNPALQRHCNVLFCHVMSLFKIHTALLWFKQYSLLTETFQRSVLPCHCLTFSTDSCFQCRSVIIISYFCNFQGQCLLCYHHDSHFNSSANSLECRIAQCAHRSLDTKLTWAIHSPVGFTVSSIVHRHLLNIIISYTYYV